MIIKVRSRKNMSFRQLLGYMVNKDERVPESRILLHNIDGEDIDTWTKAFEDNEGFRQVRRKNSVIMTHEILAWHPDDTANLSLEAIEEMARQYIQLRNPLGMYVGAIHLDKDHYHVHFCVSGVEYRSGKAMRLSKAELNTVKTSLQTYQQERFPELVNSVVAHGKGTSLNQTDKEYWRKRNTGLSSTKEVIVEKIQDAITQARNLPDIISKLRSRDIELYQRQSTYAGVIYMGRKYRWSRLGMTKEVLDIRRSKAKSR